MHYTMVFIFSVENGAEPLNAVINILDANTFSLADGPVQVQPYNTQATPALSLLKVGKNNMAVAAANTGSAALQVTAVVETAGSTILLNLSYDNVPLNASYSFPGYSAPKALQYGNNLITFPG